MRKSAKKRFLHPKFYPTRALIEAMKIAAKIPFRAQIFLGRMLGRILYFYKKDFRKIAAVNIKKCFKNKNEAAVEILVKRHFEALGIAIFETANAYFAEDEKIRKNLRVVGEEYLQKARREKCPIMLLASHFTPLMLGGRALLGRGEKIANVYRPQNNQLFDQVMCAQFKKNGALMVRSGSREMVRILKSGVPIWYAPDQDQGAKNSVFAPFFGIPTATVKATARLAKIPNTRVIPFVFVRAENGYLMRFEKPLENYPSGDDIADATATNRILERHIRENPAQYLWVHRRFKTRPDNEKSFYADG